MLHAAMVGVASAIPMVAIIAASLIAFYAFIQFLSSIFNWTCTLAGAEEGICTLEVSFSFLDIDFVYAIKLLPSKYIQLPLM